MWNDLSGVFRNGYARSSAAQDSMATAVFCTIMLAALIVSALNWDVVEPFIPLIGSLSVAVLLIGLLRTSRKFHGDAS